MRLTVDGQENEAGAGSNVWIPRGAVHACQVLTPTYRVLNTFTPAAMEAVIHALGRPAEQRELPPKGLDAADPGKLSVFANNYWGMEASVPFARNPLARN